MVVFSLLLYSEQRVPLISDPLGLRSHVKSRLKTSIDTHDPFTRSLDSALETALASHLTHCSLSDEFRPGTHDCLNEFGFLSSLLESLQTLVLLDHGRLFFQVKSALKRHFNCSQLGWVNVRELWSRGIGSLLGTYLLTGDAFFLGRAEACADRLLQINASAPLAHLRDLLTRQRAWEVERSPVDSVAGLPELLSLARITGSAKYAKRARELLRGLPADPGGLGGATASFFNILATAQVVEETKEAKRALRAVNELVAWSGVNQTLLYPLLNAVSLLANSRNAVHFRNEAAALEMAIGRHRPPEYAVFSPGDPRTLLSFRFDGTVLLVIMREDQKRGSRKAAAEIRGIIGYSLSNCRQGPGFAGIRRANSDRVYPDNIQHSSFFGHWIKAGALVARHAERLTVDGVFNERGQLISCGRL